MLGAAGAVIGTRFEATHEALITPEAVKAIIAAGAEDTTRGRALDVVRDSPWPERYPARTLGNRVTDVWQGREADIDDAAKAAFREGVGRGDPDYVPVWAGEAVDMVAEQDSAAALVGRIAREAEQAIGQRAVVMRDRVTTPFGFESTAADVIHGVDLTGKTAIVTGASSGIGVETARALAAAGASVTLAVRNTSFGDRVAAEIRDGTGNERVSVGAIDLSDLSSVAAFVRAWSGPLDILVNNAGVMAVPELTISPSGHEMQFAANHLGHYVLAVGLHDALASADRARIVSVSSAGHLRSPVVFDDIDYAFRDYDPFGAYGQSKTANVLFAVEATGAGPTTASPRTP